MTLPRLNLTRYIISLLLATPSMGADVFQTFTYPLARDYVEIIEAGKAFQTADKDIQAAMTTIARLATEYRTLNEAALMALPGRQSWKNESAGSVLVVKVADPDGSGTEFRYDRNCNSLYLIQKRYEGGRSVDVWFSRDRNASEQTLGLGTVREAGSPMTIHIYFHPEINQPSLAFPFTAGREFGPQGGSVLGWDEEGNRVLEMPVPEAKMASDVNREVFGQLTTAQLDALNIPLKSRMSAAPAYRMASKALQTTLMNLAGEAERMIDIRPDNITDTIPAQRVHHHQEDHLLIYEVEVGSAPRRTIVFDSDTRALVRIEHEDYLSLDFKWDGQRRLVGGYMKAMSVGKRKDTAVSIYPGTLGPRLAILDIDRPAGQCRIAAEVYVWNPVGERLVEDVLDSVTPLEVVLETIEQRLTSAEKSDIDWQGAETERKLLLGTR